jgi:multidrug transporter EmrE-like cation transporter
MGVFLIGSAVVFNTIANIIFKSASAIPVFTTRKGILFGVGLFLGLVNTLCYLKALEKIDLSVAYPVFSAASIILIALVSVFVFREGVSVQKAAGLLAICGGLALLWKA